MVPANDQPSAGASTTPSTGRRFDREADRHREERHPVREVGGAVERIDVPDARAAAPSPAAWSPPPPRCDRRETPPRSRSTISASERLSYSVTRLMSSDLKPTAGRVPQPLHQDLPGLAGDLGGDLARLRQRIARALRAAVAAIAHSSLRIQVAFFERASAYSAVAWQSSATTSLRSTAWKPSFSPK